MTTGKELLSKLPARPGNYRQVIETFGDIHSYIRNGSITAKWEMEQITSISVPFKLPLAWALDRYASRVRCHRLIAPALQWVFERIKSEGLDDMISDYGGCYNFRMKRTSSSLSLHSWGIAIDLNVLDNPVGSEGDMPEELIEIFGEAGFFWGGNFKKIRDPQHFQYATGC